MVLVNTIYNSIEQNRIKLSRVKQQMYPEHIALLIFLFYIQQVVVLTIFYVCYFLEMLF